MGMPGRVAVVITAADGICIFLHGGLTTLSKGSEMFFHHCMF